MLTSTNPNNLVLLICGAFVFKYLLLSVTSQLQTLLCAKTNAVVASHLANTDFQLSPASRWNNEDESVASGYPGFPSEWRWVQWSVAPSYFKVLVLTLGLLIFPRCGRNRVISMKCFPSVCAGLARFPCRCRRVDLKNLFSGVSPIYLQQSFLRRKKNLASWTLIALNHYILKGKVLSYSNLFLACSHKLMLMKVLSRQHTRELSPRDL